MYPVHHNTCVYGYLIHIYFIYLCLFINRHIYVRENYYGEVKSVLPPRIIDFPPSNVFVCKMEAEIHSNTQAPVHHPHPLSAIRHP
jgi:hypothetical protein